MVLQSPAYNNAGLGEQLQLPVAFDALQGSSMADILTLFNNNNKVFDLGQLREVVNLVGFITPAAATEAGFQNPTHMRDFVRRTRSVWPQQDGTTAGANWGSASLPADMRDASTARAKGFSRLVYDKYWDTGTSTYKNLFMYGTVGDYRIGPRAGASGRDRIPFVINFLVGSVVTGA